ncbi:MAG: undecaprenyldiphospho-muramoylpentapeptide beta-N-acetylglucosaminyltransferase [Acidobacteria bacterium]|nr:undecaprenyldiphospho-muramoylpentapeptide beta-N-acetylglucosaminyltransferase [Acidobacteriota bacterium]
MSVLIAGGGTGGHLYPGIAVARELLARAPAARVTFVGTAAGLEARVVPREGLTLDVIRSAGLKGKSPGSLLRGLALLPLSARDAWQVISRRKPEVVLGVGGYSSGPVMLLAAVRGIPTLLMEQNAMPGLTNRLLAPVVKAAAVTYEETVRFFGDKAFVSGNPVRREFFEERGTHGDDDRPPGAARVLVFGGSQGAHAINVAMVEAAPRLAAADAPVVLTHQTGERDLEMVRDGYRRAGLETRVEPFLFAMDREMTAADLVVCRAGATTLAELTACGRPSILVPLPTATDDHQRKNAEALARRGAARMVEQRELSGERLAAEILALASDREARRRMSEAARRLARPDAARVIADRVLALARGNQPRARP